MNLIGTNWFGCANPLPGCAEVNVFDPINDSEDTQHNDPLGLCEEPKADQNPLLRLCAGHEALWVRLGIGKELRDICKAKKIKVPYEKSTLAMVANRICEPESKLGVWDPVAIQSLSAFMRIAEARANV